MKLYAEELALALELHHEGIEWQYIALGLGVNPQSLRRALIRICRQGADPAPVRPTPRRINHHVNERAREQMGL